MSEGQIKVKTRDGDILEVDLYVAKQWQPLKIIFEVLDSKEAQENPIDLDVISTQTLKKIIDWSNYHKADEINTGDNTKRSKGFGQVSEWDTKFFNVPQEMIFEIILAADHLGMTELLDLGCKTVADMIKGKTPEQVRQTFNIPNDLPPLKELSLVNNDQNQ